MIALACAGLLSGCYYYRYDFYFWGYPYPQSYPWAPYSPGAPPSAAPPNQAAPAPGSPEPPDRPIQRQPLPIIRTYELTHRAPGSRQSAGSRRLEQNPPACRQTIFIVGKPQWYGKAISGLVARPAGHSSSYWVPSASSCCFYSLGGQRPRCLRVNPGLLPLGMSTTLRQREFQPIAGRRSCLPMHRPLAGTWLRQHETNSIGLGKARGLAPNLSPFGSSIERAEFAPGARIAALAGRLNGGPYPRQRRVCRYSTNVVVMVIGAPTAPRGRIIRHLWVGRI
jgi:hypothetical protein